MLLRDELLRIREKVQRQYDSQRRVLSYTEYLDLFGMNPYRHSRDASRYLKDCIDAYGSYEVERPWGRESRFALFDLVFDRDESDPARRSDHLAGHEAVQGAVYRVLCNFVREGRSNRLVLLHGPNGSAKSTFVSCLMHGLEDYSRTEEGALYRFSWIFPRGSGDKGIGFGAVEPAATDGESYALLPEERIEVKLRSELREHPLLLLPKDDRRAILAQAYAQQSIEEAPPEAVWSGELGQKNRMIFEALLTAYRGDLSRVLAHVQVERYYVSRRYRQAAVTIGPQMAVDASERQISADRTLASLPASLSALTLFEPYGELVDASGGIVEYSDLLKRPLDAWKYLLLAIEAGEVSLPFSNLPLNSVLIASSNELHLGAFREHPEYNSFRGRIHCVRVPYLTDFRREQSIYDAQIVPQIRRHVAPHTTFCAALWAVLTRLRRPSASRYDNSILGRVAESLTPVEKAMLYADGTLPSRLDSEEAKELQKGIGRIPKEFDTQREYEGLFGASPREIRSLLLDTANEERDDCVAPPALLERIQAFCERNDREFLKQKQDNGYQDSAGFVAVVREKWLDLVDDELRDATGLIDEHQHRELFDRYVVHVSFWLKKERVYNSMTGTYEEADLELMENVERRIGAGDKEEFRRTVMAKLAAHAIDNPGETPDHSDLFPQYLHKIRRSHYEERKKQVAEVAQALRSLLSDEPLHDEELRSSVDSALSVLLDRYGYERSSARIAVAALLDDRYLP